MTRSRSRARAELFKLSKMRPNLGEMFAATMELDALQDRAAAIVAAIDVEDSLEVTLTRHLRAMDETEADGIFHGDGAPLATFASKIKMAWALGLIGKKVRSDLIVIKDIRNVFAHAKRPINFASPPIGELALSLTFLENSVCPPGSRFEGKPWPPTEPRERYIETAIFIGFGVTAVLEESPAWRDLVLAD